MFIELHDGAPIAININNIQAFWYDEEFDCTCVVMNDDYEFRVEETYEEVKQLIQQSMLNEAQSQAQAVVSQFTLSR